MNENRHIPFLQKKIHFFLVLAIIGTTLLSWFNINSWLIILLVICRLADGGRPLVAVRTAFSNRYFLAYLSIFLVEVMGLFYTHDLYTAYKHIEGKATLVAVPFLFCAGGSLDTKGYRQLMRGYCLLLSAICLFCLAMAASRYWHTKDAGFFFYHALTEVIGVNAVFFSGYIVIALLFLLSPAGAGRFHTGMILFFTGVMILLASKLLLVLMLIIFLAHLKRWGRVRLKTGQFLGLAALVVLGTGAIAFTENPVGRRYKEIRYCDWQYSGKHIFPPHTVFNGVSLRLLIWQFAGEILDEDKAWIVGVSAGDSQDRLNRKYLAANMSRGFLGYNFHNQYVEVLVRSGITGLCIFVAALWVLVGLARRTGGPEASFTLVLMVLLAMTESTLEMQHSLFLFCFFPLLLGYGEGMKE